MEVVGGVASVVGILAFTGQALKGLLSLRQILDDARIKRVHVTIDLLASTLAEVERSVRVLRTYSDGELNAVVLERSALNMQVEACQQDVTQRIRLAQRLNLYSKRGLKLS